MSKKNLCTRLGIAKNTLIRYEKGLTHPDMKRLQKIADVLEVDYDQLYDDYYYLLLDFGTNIKALRKYLGLSQRAFGQLFGIYAPGTISEWEKNLHHPTHEIMMKIVKMIKSKD